MRGWFCHGARTSVACTLLGRDRAFTASPIATLAATSESGSPGLRATMHRGAPGSALSPVLSCAADLPRISANRERACARGRSPFTSTISSRACHGASNKAHDMARLFLNSRYKRKETYPPGMPPSRLTHPVCLTNSSQQETDVTGGLTTSLQPMVHIFHSLEKVLI